MLVAEKPGATLKLNFEGTAVGIWVTAGPDAGVVEYRIDGSKWKSQDLFTRWSKSLHIPWAYIFDANLTNKPHELTLRISQSKNAQSKGHAVRIVHFLVN